MLSNIRLFHSSRITLQGGRSVHLDRARGRMVLMSGFFGLAYILMAARAFDLSVVQVYDGFTPSYAVTMPAPKPAVSEVDDKRLRGKVLDRNGLVLAASLSMVSLSVDPSLILDPQAVTAGLVKIFSDLDKADLQEMLAAKNRRFAWVARNITPAQQAEVLKLGQPGLVFHDASRRIYPQGGLGGQLVGYSDIDSHGLAGVERGLSAPLSEGKDVTLAMDVRLQRVLERETGRAISEFSAKAGVGVILDIHTGEVLAGVSLPAFNPHDAGNASVDQRFNRLTLGVYELGSMFKIFSTAAFLDKDPRGMKATFDAREPLKAGRFKISDYHAQNRIMSVPEVFMYSSNIGSAKMGEAVGSEGLQEFYRDLGLLDPLDIAVKEVGHPLVPSPWRDINTLTAAYGHGLSTTPLQAATAVAAIVNGGTAVRPQLLMQKDSAQTKGMRVISEETSREMRELMRLVVTDGTGEKADVPGYELGGKTGTAEKPVNGKYDKNALISSFTGVFPMSDPQYLVFIMVDEPKGNKQSYGYATAGWVAAPAVARTVEAMAGILNIPPVQSLETSKNFTSDLRQYISTEGGAS
ncbi:MAG: penicillin-binding protein 2 [Alphaproteobacteria bacterium]|nr:penicillin-binding protein 2 [Alphaproteobacteria bacterium]